jgi:predicted ATP-dependent serine protease
MVIKTDFYRCKICNSRFPQQHLVCPVCGSVNRIIPIERDRLSFAGTQQETKIGKVFTTGVLEIDRVMNNVFSYHTISILAGQEGNGKTTLATQIVYWLACRGVKCIYFSTEEPLNKLLDRAERMNCIHPNLEYVSLQTIQEIFHILSEKDTDFIVIDSIQALKDLTEEGRVGEKNQLLSIVYKFTEVVRKNQLFCLLISHLSKSGRVSGPGTIAYQVDAVFVLDRTKDKLSPERLLVAYKNRYSTTTYVANLILTYSGFQTMKYTHFAQNGKPGCVYSIINLPASNGLVSGGYNYQEVVCYKNPNEDKGMNFINYKPQKHFVHLLKHYKYPFTLKTKVESSDVYLQFPVIAALLSLKNSYIIPSNICVIGAVEPDGALSSPVDILMRIHRAIDYRFNEFFLPAHSECILLETGSFPQDVVFSLF